MVCLARPEFNVTIATDAIKEEERMSTSPFCALLLITGPHTITPLWFLCWSAASWRASVTVHADSLTFCLCARERLFHVGNFGLTKVYRKRNRQFTSHKNCTQIKNFHLHFYLNKALKYIHGIYKDISARKKKKENKFYCSNSSVIDSNVSPSLYTY